MFPAFVEPNRARAPYAPRNAERKNQLKNINTTNSTSMMTNSHLLRRPVLICQRPLRMLPSPNTITSPNNPRMSCACAGAASGDEHEFAELCAILHQFVRAPGFGERQRPVDDGANPAALDELHRIEQFGL